jgi:hypothetical protein
MVKFTTSYRYFENQGAVKIVLCDCNLNFSGEGLAIVDITTHEGHFQIPYT